MACEVVTQIIIHAPAAQVWERLTDFAAYPRWNPFLRQVSGELLVGQPLRVQFQLPGTRAMTLRTRVERIHPGRELAWSGHAIAAQVLQAHHSFYIEPLADDRTQFIQRQNFSGLLVPVMGASLRKRTRRGFLLMNAALKGSLESS
jgi:hypothetical protein